MNDEEDDIDAFLAEVLRDSGLENVASSNLNEVSKKNIDDESEDFLEWLDNQDVAVDFQPSKTRHLDTDEYVEQDLLTSLSAELQLGKKGRQGDNIRQVLQICASLGSVPARFRVSVWMHILGIEDEEDVVLFSPRSPSNKVPADSRGERDNIVHAMTESVILRHVELLQNEKQGTNETDRAWILSEHDELVKNIKTRIEQTLSALHTPAATCDPGLADVVMVLSSRILHLETSKLPLFIGEFQRKRIFLLQLDNDGVVPGILKRRAKLLDVLLTFHDKQVADFVLGIAPSNIIIPWRWWRVAFASEMNIAGLILLWDELLIDATPASCGDDGPSQSSPLFGLPNGTDPRGPLAVYVIMALLVRVKEELLTKSTPEECLATLRSSIALIETPSEIADLCKKARLIRASTPLDIVEKAFVDERKVQSVAKKQLQDSEVAATNMSERLKSTSNWFQKKTTSWFGAMKTSDVSENLKLALGIGESNNAVALMKSKEIMEKQEDLAIRQNIQILDLNRDEEENSIIVDSGEEDEGYSDTETIAPSTKKVVQQEMDEEQVELTQKQLAAKTKHELSGLTKGDLFKIGSLRHLETESWYLFPIYRKGSLCLLLIAHYRVFLLSGNDIGSKFQETAGQRLPKTGIVDLLCGSELTIQQSIHLSQICQIVLFKRNEKATVPILQQKVKILLLDGIDQPLRFQMQFRDGQVLSQVLQQFAKDLFL